MDTLVKLLTEVLEKVLRNFRAANVKVFLAIQVALVALYFAGQEALAAVDADGVYLIASEATRKVLSYGKDVLVVIAAVIGFKIPDAAPEQDPEPVKDVSN